MHRAVSRLKMVAIQIGCTVREDTLLSDARLTDFWAEADRLGVPIAVHGPALPSLFPELLRSEPPRSTCSKPRTWRTPSRRCSRAPTS
jgi:predicted TIM-barrel fold metal-dependent hydrolase